MKDTLIKMLENMDEDVVFAFDEDTVRIAACDIEYDGIYWDLKEREYAEPEKMHQLIKWLETHSNYKKERGIYIYYYFDNFKVRFTYMSKA